MKRKVPEQLSFDLPADATPKVDVEIQVVGTSQSEVILFDQSKSLRIARDKERRIQTLLSLVSHLK